MELAAAGTEGQADAQLAAALGLAASLGISRWLDSLLFEVSTRDVATFVAVPIVLAAAAYLAAYRPAVRASRVDPVAVLREQ